MEFVNGDATRRNATSGDARGRQLPQERAGRKRLRARAPAEERARHQEARAARRAQRGADRQLCPVVVANALGLRLHHVAAAMRTAGVTGPLTLEQARGWRAMREQPPPWLAELFGRRMARSAQRAYRNAQQAEQRAQEEARLWDDVRERLLAGRRIRGPYREWIATDMAFRAMKELVRADGDPAWLCELDLAALRWAGVRPADRATWFLRRGSDKL